MRAWIAIALCAVSLFGCESREAAPPASSAHDWAPPESTVSGSGASTLATRPLDARQPLRFVTKEDRAATPRAPSVLTPEISELEARVESNAAPGEKRVLLGKLADDYAELADARMLERNTFEDAYTSIARKSPISAYARRSQAEATNERINEARRRAIEAYRNLVRDFPDDPVLDDTLFSLARECEKISDLVCARDAYHSLLEQRGDSPLVPRAKLGLAEAAFATVSAIENGGGEWSAVARAYEDVVASVNEMSEVSAYASYRLAWAYKGEGDRDRAVAAFRSAMALGDAHPELPNAEKIAAAARSDLIDYEPSGLALGPLPRTPTADPKP